MTKPLIIDKNATGNFSSSIGLSTPVVNGKAVLPISNLSLGETYIRFYYDDDGYYCENSFTVKFIPKITAPEGTIWSAIEKMVTIEMPENYNGELKITRYWNNQLYYNTSVVNGKGVINVTDFDSGSYDYKVVYTDDSYSYTEEFKINVRSENPIFDYVVEVPSKILQYKNAVVKMNFPHNPNGLLTISINDEIVKTEKDISEWNDEYTIPTSSLSPGNYEITVKYVDDYYNSFEQTYNLSVSQIVVTLPPEIVLGSNEMMSVTYISGLNGTVAVYIDGNLKVNRSLTSSGFTLDLSYLDCGEHTYEVFYSEDPDYSSKGSFNVTYEFYINVHGDKYGEEVEIAVSTYNELDGNLIISVNGKNYTVKADGWTSIKLSDLPYGENLIMATYEGDEKYPSRTVNTTVNIHSEIDMPYDAYYGKEIASIKMPEDANGILIVTIDGVEYSSPVVNGIAAVITPLLSIDGRWVNARYNGTDYEVNQDDRYVSFWPGIQFPEFMWVGGEFNVSILMPENYNGELKVTLNGNEYLGSVVDGVGYATITDVTRSGNNYVNAEYSDDTYSYSTSSNIYTYATSRDVNITADFKSDYMIGDKWAYWNSIRFPSPRKGIVDAVVDGKVVSVSYVDVTEDYDERWAFNIQNMTSGQHTVVLRYHDDPYFTNSSLTFTMNIAPIIIYVPDEIEVEDNEYMDVSVADNIIGNLTIEIDGKEFKKVLLSKEILINENPDYYEWDDYQGTVSLEGLPMGEHTYKMIFEGDFGNYSIEGEFNVSYMMSVYMDSYDDYIYFGQTVVFYLSLPSDAKGIVTAHLNGETYYEDNGLGEIFIHDLAVGNYVATFTYAGDAKYPAKSINYSFSVRGRIDVPDPFEYGKDTISITLPSNATGRLSVRVDSGSTYTVDLVDGKANFSLSNYDLGEHLIRASYTGSGYSISSRNTYIDIVPGVDISKITTSEYELTITMPENHNGNLTVYVEDVKYQSEVVGGVGRVLLTNLSPGYIYVELCYEETDGYTFENSYDFEIRGYDKDYVLSSNINRDILLGENASYDVDLPYSATGNLSIFLDGKLYGVFDVQKDNLYGEIPQSMLTIGNHTIYLEYSGDEDYYPINSTEEFNVGYIIGLPKYVFVGEYNNYVTDYILQFHKSLNGYAILLIDGVEYAKEMIIDNQIAINPINITEGMHTYEIKYSGDNNNDPISKTDSFEAIADKMSIHIEKTQIALGDTAVVRIYMPSDATGTLTLNVGDRKFNSQIESGLATFTISGLEIGTYDVNATYSGDSKYLPYSQDADNELRVGYGIRITDNGIGGDIAVSIVLPDDADGNLNVWINGQYYTVPLVDGKANYTIHNASIGEYEIDAWYDGEDYDEIDSLYETIEIEPDIVIDAPRIMEMGSNEVLVLNISDEVKGDLVVVLEEYYSDDVIMTLANLTGVSGNQTVSLAAINITGNKYIRFIFTPDGSNSISGGRSILVTPKISIPEEMEVGNDEYLTVELPEDATATINVGIFSSDVQKEYNLKLTDGKAKLSLAELPVGSYSVEISYEDDKYGNYYEYDDIAYGGFHHLEVTKIQLNAQIDNSTDKLTIVVPSDATGYLYFNVDGKDYLVEIKDSRVVIDDVGSVDELAVSYNGDSKYASSKKLIKAGEIVDVIVPVSPDLSVQVSNIEEGETAIVNVEINRNVTSVSVEVDGKTHVVSITNGKGSLNVSGLSVGEYTAVVKFPGNKFFKASEKTAAFNVTKVQTPDTNTTGNETGNNTETNETGNGTDLITPDVVVAPLDNVSSNDSVAVDVPSDATGTVTLTVGGKDYVFDVVDGKANVVLPDLADGDYPYTIKYSGDGKYSDFTTNGTLSISNAVNDTSGNGTDTNTTGNETEAPVDPDVNVPSLDEKSDGDVVPVTLPSDATGTVTLTVDGKDYVFDVVNGVANVKVPDLAKGNHTYTIKYSGDSKYNPYSENGVIVNKEAIGTVIVVESVFSRYATDWDAGERGAMFYGILYDVNKNPLVNKTVQISVNGPVYNVTTDSQGRAGLTVNLAKANTYTYALLFYGDEEYKASPMASTKLTVVKKPTSIIANNMAFKTSAKTKTVTVALNTIKNPYDGKMYLNKAKKLTLTVGGKTYTAKTGENGVANFNIKITKKGTYTATINFAGDNTYDSTSKTIKITVSNSPAKNSALNGIGVGTAPANIDAGGSPNIEGDYSKYLENKTTSDSDSIKKDTVIHVDKAFSRAANDFNAGERGDYFYAILKDSNGKPLAGKTVQIAVNGPVYEVQTDKDGKAGLQVNLAKANTYTYALSFSGDDQYNPAPIASSKLTVTKKTTSITASAKTFKASAKTKTVSVTLKTSKNPYNGKTYLSAGKKLTLKVNGKTYTAKIDKNGAAKFNIKLTKKGKYTATISFAGDSTYKESSKNVKITIK